MEQRYLGRCVAAGIAALVLTGAGVAGATTPPSEPPGDTASADTMTADTLTADTAMGASSEPMAGGGPSDCPAITATADSAPAATSDAATAGTTATSADESMATTATSAGETMATTATSAGETMATTGTSAGETMATTATSGGESMATTGSEPAVSGPFVQIAESDEYGPILVDSACRTLYGFTQDVDGEPTCVDDCAANWPPLLVDGDAVPPVADELDPTLFSVVDHPEGSMLKVGDWPLYYFAADTAPGDVNGQGVGGVWWVVGPDGTLLEEATTGTEPTTGSAAPDASAPTASVPAASAPTDSAPATSAG